MVTFITIFIILSSTTTTIAGAFSDQSPIPISPNRMEKTTHLQFYFHDIVSGKNATAIQITQPPAKTSGVGFGSVFMTDDALTESQDPKSKLVGRAQGMYGIASQSEIGLLMVMNIEFVEGKLNGSGLTIVGRNKVFDTVREMPVIGGVGVFRLARGYALAKTVWLDVKTGDAIVQYNVTVLHF